MHNLHYTLAISDVLIFIIWNWCQQLLTFSSNNGFTWLILILDPFTTGHSIVNQLTVISRHNQSSFEQTWYILKQTRSFAQKHTIKKELTNRVQGTNSLVIQYKDVL